MAMTSWPFTSQNTGTTSAPVWDRAVGSGVLRNIFTQFFGNGVFPNPSTNFQVVQDTGMQVKVKSGSCTINGATAFENTDRILVVQAADTNDRIDTVVLRLNDNNAYRNIDLYVVKGTAASVPEAPALTRTSSIHELGIANLYISANSSTISQERITDTRLDTTRCGYSMPIQEIDTSALYTQIQSDLVAFQGVNEADFTAWFNEMKDQLSTDAAGNLQSEIGILSDLATAAKENIVSAINEVKQDVSDAIEELNNNLNVYYDKERNVVQLLTDEGWVDWTTGALPMEQEMLIINNGAVTSEAEAIVLSFVKTKSLTGEGYGHASATYVFLSSDRKIKSFDIIFHIGGRLFGGAGCNVAVTFNNDSKNKTVFTPTWSGDKVADVYYSKTIDNIDSKALTVNLEFEVGASQSRTAEFRIDSIYACFE